MFVPRLNKATDKTCTNRGGKQTIFVLLAPTIVCNSQEDAMTSNDYDKADSKETITWIHLMPALLVIIFLIAGVLSVGLSG